MDLSNQMLCVLEAKFVIDLFGLLYDVAKDIKDYLEWEEDVKLVDREWLDKSGFRAASQARGYELRWSKPERVASRTLDGFELMYEIDKVNRVRKRIELPSGSERLVLLGKKPAL